jgi:citronellyl-CoA dehydrogenase
MHLTHEHRELERTTRRIIAEHLDPYLDEWEAEQIFPAHRVMKAFGSAGLLGIGKAAEYGGMELDFSY